MLPANVSQSCRGARLRIPWPTMQVSRTPLPKKEFKEIPPLPHHPPTQHPVHPQAPLRGHVKDKPPLLLYQPRQKQLLNHPNAIGFLLTRRYCVW